MYHMTADKYVVTNHHKRLNYSEQHANDLQTIGSKICSFFFPKFLYKTQEVFTKLVAK